MYRAFVEVVPEASGFTGALTSDVKSGAIVAGDAGGKAGGKAFLGGFGKAFAGGLAALGIADILSSAADYVGDSIMNATAFEQNAGAVRDVFKEASGDVEKFADAAADTIGLSANQALVGARTFGVFGKAAGLTGTELADFSTDLLTLGADLAAFGNTSPEEAVGALGAALRGEYDSLEKYGVILNESTLKQIALEKGISDGSATLTTAQKIMAVNAALWEQTGVQQGKFAAEADTLAGKQATLAAGWENISTSIGTAFMPVAEDLIDVVANEMVPALEDFAVWLQEPDVQEALKDLGHNIVEVGNFMRDMGVAFVDTQGLINGVVGLFNGDLNFDEFKRKMTELPGLWGMVFRAAKDAGSEMGATVGTMIWNVKQFAGEVGTNIGNVVSWFGSLPGRVADAVRGIGGWLYNSGKALIQGFIDGINAMFAPIGRAVGGVLDFVAGFFPHSPAEHGPFSGSGWTALGNSGVAIANQFAAGLESQYRQLQAAAGGLMQAAAPADASTGRPIQMDIHPAPGMSEEMIGRIAAERLNFVLRGR